MNIPIRKFPLEQLRKSIGFVPQETFLFSNTLADNIAFGVEDESSKFKVQSSKSKTHSRDNGQASENGQLNESKIQNRRACR